MAKMTNNKEFVADIDALIKLLKTELPADIKKTLQTVAVEKFPAELQKTHEKEQDPYGMPWKEAKTKQDHPLLDDTGKLKRAYKATYKASGASLTNTKAYAPYHNQGTQRLPQRLLLPSLSKGLPKDWKKLLQDAVNLMLKRKDI